MSDDGHKRNHPAPLALAKAPSLGDMVLSIRGFPLRERAAKAVSLQNEALQMERQARFAGHDDAVDLIRIAAQLREIAEAIRPWGEV